MNVCYTIDSKEDGSVKKKISLIFFNCLVCIFTIGIVRAETIEYEMTWASDARTQYDPRVVENTRNFLFKDGYLFVDSKGLTHYGDYGDTELSYYDKDGKLVVEKSYEEIGRLAVVNDNIYLFDSDFVYDKENEKIVWSYYIHILDETLEIKKTIDITGEVYDQSVYYNLANYENEGLATAVSENEKVIFLSFKNLISLDTTTDTIELLEKNDENLQKYFPLIYLRDKEEKSNFELFSSYAIADDKVIKVGYYYEDETSVDSYALLKVYEGETEVLKKQDKNYSEYTDVKIINDNIVLTALYTVGEGYASSKSDILIYDFDGNLIQKISNNSKYMAIEENVESFVVTRFYVEGTCDYKTGGDVEVWDSSSCNTYLYHENYSLVKSGFIGETVGKTENPDTAAVSIIGLLIITGVAFYVYKVTKKKMNVR